jgi:RimJ/RimL family protein N-acetyltransferase
MSNQIHIRRYRPEDVDALAEAVLESRAELSPWMPWCHPEYSRQDAVTWVDSRPQAWEQNQENSFLIVDARDRLLGTCGLHHIDLRNHLGEIGYWVRSSATRQGVATQAVRRLCQWAFEEGGFHRIEIVVSVENRASQRVAEKAGGIREGILRERLLLQGRRHDCVLFSILNRER